MKKNSIAAIFAALAMVVTGLIVVNHPTAQASPSAPAHVLTWVAWGGKEYSQDQHTASEIAPFTNFVLTANGPAALTAADEARAAGIKTVMYTDVDRQQLYNGPGTSDPLYTSNETTFAHDCNGNRPTFLKPPPHAVMNLMDPHSHVLWNLWKGEMDAAASHYDYFFEDTADSTAYFTPKPCNFSQSVWDSLTNQMDTYVGYSLIFNGLNPEGGGGTSPVSKAILPTTSGGMAEGCYIGYSYLNQQNKPNKVSYAVWKLTENEELQVASMGKHFICHEADTRQSDSSLIIDQRIYQYASFLLTYDLSTTVFASNYGTATYFPVYPETELVATNPVVPTPNDIAGLLTSTGAYGREYLDCFINGVDNGPCAVGVNSQDSGTVAFPFTGYTRTFVISGQGVLDGGSVSVTGQAPGSLAPHEAEIAFK